MQEELSAKIQFHFYYANPELNTGAARHIRSLHRAFKKLAPMVVFKFWNIIDVNRDRVGVFKRLWHSIRLSLFCSLNKDLLIVTDLTPVFSLNRNLIIMVFDARETEGWLARHSRWSYGLKYLALKHSKVVVCSDYTKRCLRKFGVSDVSVIPLGVNQLWEGRRDASCAREIDLLVVGQYSKRKNHVIVAEAINRLALQGVEPKVVFVGANGPTFGPLCELLSDAKNSLILRDVSDEEIASLYFKSKIVIIPTFFEGFGMPAIEGYFANCQLLLSDFPAAVEFEFPYTLLSNYSAGLNVEIIKDCLTNWTGHPEMYPLEQSKYFYPNIARQWLSHLDYIYNELICYGPK